MNEAFEYIKSKHNGEIPYKYGANECAKLMDAYAKYYHEQQLKILNTPITVGQSEQFICPCCGSDKTYKTEAYHCNRCAVTTEL